MFKLKIVLLLILLISYINIGYGSDCTFGLCKVDSTLQTDDGLDIGDKIIDLIKYILGFVGLISVIFAIKGGFNILIAMDNDEKVKNGKKTLLYALLGIFIISISWVIVDGTIGILEKK